MSLEFEIPLISFIFILVLTIMYFSKNNMNFIENRAYEEMIVAALIESLLDFLVHLLCSVKTFEVLNTTYYPLINFVNKILATLIVAVFVGLLCYTIIITFPNAKKKSIYVWRGCLLFIFTFFAATFFTKINLISVGSVTNVNGGTISLGYAAVVLVLATAIIISLSRVKKLDRRYLPIFLVLVVLCLCTVLTLVCPGIIIYDAALAITVYIMYFTIENPDLKVIDELNKNRLLVEQSHESKTNLTFKLLEDVKPGLLQIKLLSNKIDEEIDPYTNLDKINIKTTELLKIMNDVLDITDEDKSNIKVYKSTYDFNRLFEEVTLITKKRYHENLNFDSKMLNKVSTEVYGDKIVLKQVLYSILENFNRTVEEGNVLFEVNPIVSNDIIKFVLTFKVDKKVLELDEINSILNVSNDLTEEAISSLETINMDFNVIHKMIKMLGGSLIIKSDAGLSEFIITLNQKVYQSANLQKAKQYGLKKVLVISESTQKLDMIDKILSKYNIEINNSINGSNLFDEIKSNYYDFIFVDSMLNSPSAITVINEVKNNNLSNARMIVIVDRIQEKVKDNYVNEYNYNQAFMFDDLEREIDKLSNKF